MPYLAIAIGLAVFLFAAELTPLKPTPKRIAQAFCAIVAIGAAVWVAKH